MDYEALAKQYGGIIAPPPVDYEALAKQYGGAIAAPSEIPGDRQQPGLMARLGRGAASLADVTVGGVLPAIVQQAGYPLARLGRSPEQAQAATARLVSAVESPIGKTFGVTETPEYQSETGRQIIDFIGQNVQKGAKWIAGKTGIPQSDVENYLGTATLAAPKVVPPVARAIRDVTAPTIERAVIGAKMPFEPMLQARRERKSAESYARGPELDAIAEAQRLKLVVDPRKIDPSSVEARALSLAAGPRGPEAMVSANTPRVTEIAKNELGVPATTSLTSKTSFNDARANLAGPYDEVSKLPTMTADKNTVANLNALRKNDALIGGKGVAKKVNGLIDEAVTQAQAGLTGAELLANIQNLRADAKKIYRNTNATPKQIAVADANLTIAHQLELMIESNVTNPKLLDQLRSTREKMARSYAYEGATDFNTGLVDVSKLARITSKDNALTGDIASLGKIAGNFPEAFAPSPESKFFSVPRLSRAGVSGTAGALIGGELLGLGTSGYILGTAGGALLGDIAGKGAAGRLSSPKYQAGLNLQDFRIPVNQLAASMQPIPQDRSLVPYEPEVVGPSKEGAAPSLRIVGYDENDRPIYAPSRAPGPPGTGFTTQADPIFGNRPTTFVAQRGLPNPVPGQIYDAQRRADLAQGFRERDERKPTKGGIELIIDAAGNLVEAPAATAPKTLAPSALESAVQKMAGQMAFETRSQYKTTQTGSYMDRSPVYQTQSVPLDPAILTRPDELRRYALPTRESQAFAMTAEEKIAWNKAKADLAEVVPGMKSLSNEAVAARIADRDWTANAVASARAKVEALARQDALLTEQLANRDNLRLLARDIESKQRQLAKIKEDSVRIRDLADMLDETMRAARPDTSRRQQGPKTRAAKRNALAPDNQNNLAP
jgi:hypothetical protein